MTRLCSVLPVLLAPLAGCDYSGDFLFPDNTTIDDIWVLTAEDGGFLVPADIASQEDILANTIYAEVGAPNTTANGGITVDFVGTGGPVCIWVDPEIAFWNQAVEARIDPDVRKWSHPDNVFDDGDIDLFAGLSVYYTGSPGETIGDFVVAYEDGLGNDVPISLAACPNLIGILEDPAASGRGSPEFCEIQTTDLGIGYTILLQTFATPRDDSRLSFGFILANGPCDQTPTAVLPAGLRQIGGSGSAVSTDECVIQGESLIPRGDSVGPYYGFDAVNDDGRIWDRTIEFEEKFCAPYQDDQPPADRLDRFCTKELDQKVEEGVQCEQRNEPTNETRCFCGDLNDTPSGGAI